MDQLSVLVDNAVGIGIANYVAQNYGAGKMDRIKKGVWHCFLMLTAMNFAMGALLLLGQNFVVPMFVTNPTAEIMQYSKDYLFMVVPFYFFLGALLVYRTAIQSVGNTWAPFAACVIELAAENSVCVCVVRSVWLPCRLLCNSICMADRPFLTDSGLYRPDPEAGRWTKHPNKNLNRRYQCRKQY